MGATVVDGHLVDLTAGVMEVRALSYLCISTALADDMDVLEEWLIRGLAQHLLLMLSLRILYKVLYLGLRFLIA